MKRARYAIERQIETNRRLNLLYDHVEDVVHVDTLFAHVLTHIHHHEPENIGTLISYTVEKTISTLYAMNQFLSITPDHKEELCHIYTESWKQYDPTNSLASIQAHHRRLSHWISHLYPAHFTAILKTKEHIGEVVNAQYSAEFQIYVLDVEIEHLMEPIIDIGCGSQATLVRHISSYKHDVIGIDRELDMTSMYTQQIDWFDFQFPPRFYGTIIANMSFSNHLVFHMHNRTKHLPHYVLKYREILESMKPGGIFVYAPSLPFIEERLDRMKYAIDITDVGKKNTVTKIRCLAL